METKTKTSHQVSTAESLFDLTLIETMLDRVKLANKRSPSYQQKKVLLIDWKGNRYLLRKIEIDQDGKLVVGSSSLALHQISGILVGTT